MNTRLSCCAAYFSLAVSLIPCMPAEAACLGKPATQRFVIATKGTAVLDCVTGYIWFRCAVGLEWNAAANQCTGVAYRATWADVKGYAAEVKGRGYALPTQRQLAELVGASQWFPRIDPVVFPNTPAGSFWTQEAFSVWTPETVVPPGLVDFTDGRAQETRMSPGTGFFLRYMLIPGSADAVAAGIPSRPRQ